MPPVRVRACVPGSCGRLGKAENWFDWGLIAERIEDPPHSFGPSSLSLRSSVVLAAASNKARSSSNFISPKLISYFPRLPEIQHVLARMLEAFPLLDETTALSKCRAKNIIAADVQSNGPAAIPFPNVIHVPDNGLFENFQNRHVLKIEEDTVLEAFERRRDLAELQLRDLNRSFSPCPAGGM